MGINFRNNTAEEEVKWVDGDGKQLIIPMLKRIYDNQKLPQGATAYRKA